MSSYNDLVPVALAVLGFASLTGAVTGSLSVDRLISLDNKVNSIERKLEQYNLKEENVLGGMQPETFFEIDGQRYFLTVDGKPLEQYLRETFTCY